MNEPKTPAEILTDINANIEKHDAAARAAAKHSNAHAYNHGQASKYLRIQRLLLDITEAEQRFAEITNPEA